MLLEAYKGLFSENPSSLYWSLSDKPNKHGRIDWDNVSIFFTVFSLAGRYNQLVNCPPIRGVCIGEMHVPFTGNLRVKIEVPCKGPIGGIMAEILAADRRDVIWKGITQSDQDFVIWIKPDHIESSFDLEMNDRIKFSITECKEWDEVEMVNPKYKTGFDMKIKVL